MKRINNGAVPEGEALMRPPWRFSGFVRLSIGVVIVLSTVRHSLHTADGLDAGRRDFSLTDADGMRRMSAGVDGSPIVLQVRRIPQRETRRGITRRFCCR